MQLQGAIDILSVNNFMRETLEGDKHLHLLNVSGGDILAVECLSDIISLYQLKVTAEGSMVSGGAYLALSAENYTQCYFRFKPLSPSIHNILSVQSLEAEIAVHQRWMKQQLVNKLVLSLESITNLVEKGGVYAGKNLQNLRISY